MRHEWKDTGAPSKMSGSSKQKTGKKGWFGHKKVQNVGLRWRMLSRRDNPANYRGRIISIGRRQNFAFQTEEQDLDQAQVEFVNNAVKSSKYTIWTFFPRYVCNLQFHNIIPWVTYNCVLCISGICLNSFDALPTFTSS